jgi:uncharacterized protein (TIGR03435 family)
MRCVAFIVLGAAILSCALAQPESGSDVSFDVASLKPSRPTPPYLVVLGITNNGTTMLTDVTLVQALMFAFGFTATTQVVSPAWTRDGSELFDIVGKAPPDTPSEKIRPMTLNLLTDQFHLQLHHEQRDIPYYARLTGKKGSKLKAGTASPEHPCANDSVGHVLHAGRGLIEINCVSLATLIQALEFVQATGTNRPIVDLTQLTGHYDVKLEWSPQASRPSDAAAVAGSPGGLPFLDALPEQLGLNLELRSGPMDVVVIDGANPVPEPN